MPEAPTGRGADKAGGPPIFKMHLTPDTVSIPLRLGEIKDSFRGSNGKTVIHIQDAHCNYGAQKSIDRIIGYLTNTYDNVRIISLEGGTGTYDLSPFTAIDNPRTREKVADYFVKNGRVSGAEYFAINNPGKARLFGIEDEALYRENLATYRDSLIYKAQADKDLAALSRAIENLKDKIYSPELKELDTAITGYRANKIALKEYLFFLQKKAARAGVALKDFQSIASLITVLSDEQSIDFKKADVERSTLIDRLSAKLSSADLQEFIAQSLQFKSGDISGDLFYGYLFKKARFTGTDFSTLPNLVRYSEYLKKYNSIDKHDLFEEIKKLEASLVRALAGNNDQTALYSIENDLSIVKNMLLVSLTKDDFDYYTDNTGNFDGVRFLDFINQQAPLHDIPVLVSGDIGQLDTYRKNMEKFYTCSLKRDDAFIANIGKNLNDEHEAVTILVTGGFHTGNISKLFKDQGYSYIEILPDFENTDEACPYFRLLSGEKDDLDKFLITAVAYAPPRSNIAIQSLFSRMAVDVQEKNMCELEVQALTNILEGRPFTIRQPWGYVVIAPGEIMTAQGAIGGFTTEAGSGLSASFFVGERLPAEFGIDTESTIMLADGDTMQWEAHKEWIDKVGRVVGTDDLADHPGAEQGLKDALKRLGLVPGQIDFLFRNEELGKIKIWKQIMPVEGHAGGAREGRDNELYLSPELLNNYDRMALVLLHEVGAAYRIKDADNIKPFDTFSPLSRDDAQRIIGLAMSDKRARSLSGDRERDYSAKRKPIAKVGEKTTSQVVGFFPGLGSLANYQNLGNTLYDRVKDIPQIHRIYEEAATALAEEDPYYLTDNRPDVTKLFFTPDQAASLSSADKSGRLAAAFVIHNVALAAYLKQRARENGIPLQFKAYTGESIGILTAAIASGALSVGDGVKIARYFAPCLLSYAVKSKMALYHVVGIKVRDPQPVIDKLKKRFGDNIEVHKFYAAGPKSQVNIYVCHRVWKRFQTFMTDPSLEATFEELKSPTRFIAHSSKMAPARHDIDDFINSHKIDFHDPDIPIISNNNSGVLRTAVDVIRGVLAIVDEPMYSETTVKLAEEMEPDMILEIGLGGQSVELVKKNYANTPCAPYHGEDANDKDIFSALQLIDELKTRTEKLKTAGPNSSLGKADYDLLRKVFTQTHDNDFGKQVLFNFISTLVVSDLAVQEKLSPAYYKFMEILQNTYLIQNVLKNQVISADVLVLSAIFKKRIGGKTRDSSNKIDIDLTLLDRNDAQNMVTFMDFKYPETVTYTFYQLPMEFRELAKETVRILEVHPLARQIYGEIQKDLGLKDLSYFTDQEARVDDIRRSEATIAYQYAMFRLMQLYKPAVFGQNIYSVTGLDDVGRMTALAASGALSAADSIKFFRALRTHDEATLDTIHIGQNATIRILDTTTMARFKKEQEVSGYLQRIRQGQYKTPSAPAAVQGTRTPDPNTLRINLDFPSWIVSFDPHKTSLPGAENMQSWIVHLSDINDVWRRNINPDLDILETLSILRLTDQNGKVYRFAEDRGTTTSNVYSYVFAGETVVGFGKGGSESLTIFLRKPGERQITVRKVLSERLVTAQWDQEGKGVMLPPFTKAKRQVEYLQGLPPKARALFPRVLSAEERDIPIPPDQRTALTPKNGVYHEYMYDMSYVPGIELSEFIRQYKPKPEVVARIYEEIFRVLETNIHSYRRNTPTQPTLESSYFKKIEDRLALSQRTAPNTFNNDLLQPDYIYIDGKRYLNIHALLKKFREHPEYLKILEPRFHSLVMGDTNTENIKITDIKPILEAMLSGKIDFTAEEIGIKFLDPRAIGFHVNGQDTGADDPMYDNKPWHNSIGNYDPMHGEYFALQVKRSPQGTSINVDFDEDNPYKASYEGIERYFRKTMTDAWGLDKPDSEFLKHDPYWLIRFVFMMGTHFTAMPPFHFKTDIAGNMVDDYQHQKRPVAIYAEGIKWLNMALQMLEGQRTEYLGFQVPKLPYLEQPPTRGPPADSPRSQPQMRLDVLTKETRTFVSPWTRIVRGIALGQHPIDYDKNTADHIRTTLRELDNVVQPFGTHGQFNRFAQFLTPFILDMNNPAIRFSQVAMEARIDLLINELEKIQDPYLFVDAASMLFTACAKLKIDTTAIKERGLVKQSLDKLQHIKFEEEKDKGVYERLIVSAGLFLSIGQLGWQDELVKEKDHVHESLELLSRIPSAFYRGRAASTLFSVLGVLGYRDRVLGYYGKDYMKEILDYLDERLDKAPEIARGAEKIFDNTYPVYTMLNAIAVLNTPQYLTYRRDWLDEAMVFFEKISPDDAMNQFQYLMIALYNLGKLDEYIPDLRSFMNNIVANYRRYQLSNPAKTKQDILWATMDESYAIETAWLSGLGNASTEASVQLIIQNLRNFSFNEPYFNAAYGLSYTLNPLLEIGRADLLFTPNWQFEGQSPVAWTIRQFAGKAEADSVTLPYIYHVVIDNALRMRRAGAEETPIFKNLTFVAKTGQKSPVPAMAGLSNERRAFSSPWARIVRGVALGQNPIDYDNKTAGRIRETFKQLNGKVAATNHNNRFSHLLTELILDVNNPEITLSREDISKRVDEIVAELTDIKHPLQYVTASATLFDTFAKLNLDASLLVNDKRDLVKAALEMSRSVVSETGAAPGDIRQGRGPYDRITALAALFVAAGQLGFKKRLITPYDYVQESLDLLEKIPSAFYRGRAAAMLFSALGVLGFGNYVYAGRRDYLKETMDVLNDSVPHTTDDVKTIKSFFPHSYAVFTMLNAIAILGKPEYLTYRRNWLDEARWLMSNLTGSSFASMGHYYLIALNNLGVLDTYVPNIEDFLKKTREEILTRTKKDSIHINVEDSYFLSSAYMFGRLDLIPDEFITMELDALRAYPKNESWWNSAFGASYVLTMFGETGRADLLFEPNPQFDGMAPIPWVIEHFSDGAETESAITLPYMDRALINYALRMRGHDKKDTPAPVAKSGALENPGGIENLSAESRTFLSPWVRFVHGTALGQYPIDFDANKAKRLRDVVLALETKILSDNMYNEFAIKLTRFILDVNNPSKVISPTELKRRIDDIVYAISFIPRGPLLAAAWSILFES
ncbi:MAG: hypothetical protein PHS37_01805, partial [Candidatus Omnitrophica bacterium]|nr:hypothetical protein [Candidatus Omnitrophota bacterium]